MNTIIAKYPKGLSAEISEVLKAFSHEHLNMQGYYKPSVVETRFVGVVDDFKERLEELRCKVEYEVEK